MGGYPVDGPAEKRTQVSDTLARGGGDEFVVLHTDIGQPVAAGELAQRLIKLLSEPFELSDLQIRIGISIGIALYPWDGNTAAAC